MAKIEIRPRFQRWSKMPQSEVLEKFRIALEQEDAPVKGYLVDEHIYLKIPLKDQHFWSPQLNLEIEESEHGCLIRGLFGPNPSVWLMFIFFYFLLGFLSVVVLIIGTANLNLGLSAKILWALPVLAILIFLVFSTAKTGQKLGHDEMKLLFHFFENTIME